ncbi:uncharacterized protein [Spinacia oleracea]|uniref:MI domain-containing protein n=1 Tax=Spinacia oleracea TaxID=3562 RepID=A0A9R0I5T9_SPIOL|nr:uncharacterized protein LOC110783094 [Spinacia oleracea]
MPRSSRHKSSKHSSREVRDYSDSEKDSGLKEKKGRDDGGSYSSRHLKESTSGEKRKIDSKSVDVTKDLSGVVVNVDYVEEYVASSSSSKKRKEKEDDDRWTGGDNNEHDLSKSDSKRSSRREENSVAGVVGEEVKKSGSKVESKHHRSERKERSEKEGGSERDRKGNKGDRLIVGIIGNENVGNEGNRKQGNGEERGGKHGVGITELNIQEEVRNPDTERELDRRVRRKRDGSGDGDKHQEGTRELDDRRLSSRDDIVRSGKYKDESHKEERVRDRYQEDADKDNWHPDEKQRDNRVMKDYNSARSEDKHLKNEKKDLDVSQKKSKPLGSEYDREPDRDRDHDRERGRDRDRARHDRDRDRDREHDDREHDLDRERDRERDLERTHDRDRELDRDRERGRDRYHRERDRDRIRDHNHDRARERDYDHEYGSHVNDKGSRYKDDRSRRRSPEGHDDYHGDKSRRIESEADKEKSLPRKAHVDSVVSSSRRKNSPSRAYVSTDKYRDGIQDETKYGDSPRDGPTSEALDKVPKYRSGEKRTKFDENYTGELSERSPSAKASPAGLKEKSPSTSVDRRFQNRTSRRRSLDVDEAERRSSGSNDVRDISVNEDRQGREYSAKKSNGEEFPPVESPFHHKSNQGNISSHVPGPSGFRTGADSPSFMGSLGEDNRGHSGSRFRRSVDPNNIGRGPGNPWKGAPNWPSPLPNGFLPFPPGPPGPHHGGFPPMLSQFPPLFGVRPSMDMNHPGMPYHMSDGERFSGHVRPMGWQNMVDGPVHFHGWDVSNGVLRDESSMYGPGHLVNSQRRDMNSDMWKPNGDVNMDVTSVSQKDSPLVKTSVDEASSTQGASRPHVESSLLDEGTSLKMNTSSVPSSTKENLMTLAKVTEKTPESSSVDDAAQSVRAYLTKLDISIDMADPELYNQFIELAFKGQSDLIEEVELEYIEEKAVADSEIANLTMGLTFFPAAKDSIFKKAMNLYKTQSTQRSSSGIIPNLENSHSPKSSELEVEKTSVEEEMIVTPVNCIIKKEDSILVVPEVVSNTPVVEGKEPVSITNDTVMNEEPFQSADMALDLCNNQGESPVLMVEKMDEEIKLENEPLFTENANSDAIESNTDRKILGNDNDDGGMRVDAESATSDEQMDVAVSGPLVLTHDSVKVCEALISVSNESDSVILSRIHHAPESTH